MTTWSGAPSSSRMRSTSSWASRSCSAAPCRAAWRDRCANGTNPVAPQRRPDQSGSSPAPSRRQRARAGARPTSISRYAASRPPAAASLGASLGCRATPPSRAGWASTALTVKRAPSRSQPICSRSTPTEAAAATASCDVGASSPSRAMSRWCGCRPPGSTEGRARTAPGGGRWDDLSPGVAISRVFVGAAEPVELLLDDRLVEFHEDRCGLAHGRADADRAGLPGWRRGVLPRDHRVGPAVVEVGDLLDPRHGHELAPRRRSRAPRSRSAAGTG